MPTTRAQTAPQPWALFEACLHGNVSIVARLLEGPGAGTLQQEGPCGLTLLHAAVIGGAAAALPLLVADGAPVNSELNCWSSFSLTRRQQMLEFLRCCGCQSHAHLDEPATALRLAVRLGDSACIEQLLQLGASPLAGSSHWDSTAWHALRSLQPTSPAACEDILGPFLRHGFDPLAPGPDHFETSLGRYDSLVLECRSAEVRRHLLAHLEKLRAAGQLQLGGKEQAAQLVRGAAKSGMHPLMAHGITALESLICPAPGADEADSRAAAAAPWLSDADAALLKSVVMDLIHLPDIAPLTALLASTLPFNEQIWEVEAWDPSEPVYYVPLLARAALSSTAHPDACRLLHRAGVPLTADDLYACIDKRSPAGVSRLLACGTLAVDTSQPASPLPHPEELGFVSYSCPIHRTLHDLAENAPIWSQEPAIRPKLEARTVRILEALLAAGFRPCTWHNTAAPDFLQPTQLGRVLPVLDPFDLYSRQRSEALGFPIADLYNFPDFGDGMALGKRVVFVARGGTWSQENHRYWPDSFKAAAHAFLLAVQVSAAPSPAPSSLCTRGQRKRWLRASAAATAARSSRQGCFVGDLPPGVVLHILRLAAAPISSWLQSEPSQEEASQEEPSEEFLD